MIIQGRAQEFKKGGGAQLKAKPAGPHSDY